MTQKSIEKLLVEIFGGNSYHSQAREAENGDIYYSPIEVELTEDLVTQHLAGEVKLGAYQLIQGSNVVKWLGWDVDSHDLKTAREQAVKITRHLGNIPYAVEFSGRKGYHILIFLSEPMPATDAKKVVDWVRETEGLASSGNSHVECFPKQDKLSKARPKGNLLKIPLGEHPKSHDRSRFIDPLNGWEGGLTLDPQDILSYRSVPSDVMSIISEGPPASEQLVQLVSEYWTDGKRHDMSLYLSGYLAHESWGIDQTSGLIHEICIRTGDDQEFNRQDTVTSTFQKHKEGKVVRGRQGLGEILPVNVMQRLTELVAELRAPDTVSQVDDIRYAKSRPQIENVRLASNTIWSILNDDADRVFMTDQRVAYWYDGKTHTVTEEGTEMWKTMLNKQFGLNPMDGFSKLVYAELRLRIVREAPVIPVQNRTYWSESTEELFINLGGPEVYIMDGIEIRQGFNGECGYMFITNDIGKYIVPDFDADPIDAWDHLVNDLNFTTSADAPAKPEQQRELLKAWLMAFFFQELMPTKPILSMLGQPGSGKTTAIRRILRIVEEPDADVLGVPTDKQDAFRASIASHRLLVMDNLEKSGASWMVDILNKLATGNNIELRELYKTNAKHLITPRCFVAITAVNLPFSDETLFSRLLILEMQKLDEPLPEHVLQRRIREFGPAVWANLLEKLNTVVRELRKHKLVRPPSKSRLVDFNVFCAKIRDSGVVNGDELELGLLSMIDSQLMQLKESSRAMPLLEEWISTRSDEAADWHDMGALYSILQGMAQIHKMDFPWKNPQGLSRHILTLEQRLKEDYGGETREHMSPLTKKTVTEIRFRRIGELQ